MGMGWTGAGPAQTHREDLDEQALVALLAGLDTTEPADDPLAWLDELEADAMDAAREWEEAVAKLRVKLGAAWAPRERLSITAVAERHRMMPGETSSNPGQYRAGLTPWVQEIQDRLHPDDPAQVIVYEAAAQAGGKSTIAENWVLAVAGGYYPARMLYALDTDRNAQDWSKDNLDTMIDHCPMLQERVRAPVSRGKNETILGKWFAGGRLRIVGAHSASALCRIAAKYVVMDECDRWKENPGYEGNAVSLVLARQTTYGPARKAYICSTPTVENDSEIHEWFLRGDQRLFEVPCPRCGRYQAMEWRDPIDKTKFRLVWMPGRPDEARYICKFCDGVWEEHEKNLFLPQGRWVATRPDLGGGIITSYNLNALYAPNGTVSWAELASDWEAAIALSKTGDVEKLRSFVNVRLAEVFAEPGDMIDKHALQDLVEPDWGAAVPAGVLVVTCATDVQDNRLETMTVGWGLGWECWILDYSIILSDPRDQSSWDRHDQLIARAWKTTDGRTLYAAATCVDSGFLPQRVLEYCKPRLRYHVYPIKGDDSRGPIWDKKIRHAGKKATRTTFHMVRTISAKDDLQAYLAVARPGPKHVHIPDRIVRLVPDFLDQLSSERRLRSKNQKGRVVVEWKKITESRRNEAWDTLVYNLAAAHSLVMGGMQIELPPGATPPAPLQEEVEARAVRAPTLSMPVGEPPVVQVGGKPPIVSEGGLPPSLPGQPGVVVVNQPAPPPAPPQYQPPPGSPEGRNRGEAGIFDGTGDLFD